MASRIRQNASTCDFSSIKDPLDEAMRTCFVCSINNEAILKAVFKIKEDELSFSRAVQVASEVEDAAKIAKETVYGAPGDREVIHKIQSSGHSYVKEKQQYKSEENEESDSSENSTNLNAIRRKKGNNFSRMKCFTCGKTNHLREDCRFRGASCNFCNQKGHLEAVCFKKGKHKNIRHIFKSRISSVHKNKLEKLRLDLDMADCTFSFEVDTGSADNFMSVDSWRKIGKPELMRIDSIYESASLNPIPVKGVCKMPVTLNGNPNSAAVFLEFTVTQIDKLNLIGLAGISALGLSLDGLLAQNLGKHAVKRMYPVLQTHSPGKPSADPSLKAACEKLCRKFPNLWKADLGTLKDYELDVKFKENTSPIFLKARTVPLAIQEDLSQAIESGIKRGVWKKVQFNEYGTPVVPIIKKSSSTNGRPAIRVCGDYSVTVNQQLEKHRHPMPSPESLMHRLGGNYCFSKVDLADAYNQIQLSPSSQRKLALSTHKGVLLQLRLPFGITSAPGYFQSIMEQITSDLPGVAVYLDDILVGGSSAGEHLENLERLLARLDERGLRCRLNKCRFAEPCVEYLGHRLSTEGVAKCSKVDAVLDMPAPNNISALKSFLGSIQFYSKFIPNIATITEPLYKLTRKGETWHWGQEQEKSFNHLKTKLTEDTVLVHYDPSLLLGVSCDASSVGIGAVLFHRYGDGSERPIANASKTLTSSQRSYSQIQKEALAIVFAFKKFHQYLYGRNFVLVTDHKPLLAIFGQNKAIPTLAANRLARWALTISQYDYIIEYRKSEDHGNADALSRLPIGEDADFDIKEDESDTFSVCTIHTISDRLDANPATLRTESRRDSEISTIMRFVRDGWPQGRAILDSEEYSENIGVAVKKYEKIKDSLLISEGCLFYGTRLVIPQRLRNSVLQILHTGHFGIQRMKMLARSAVYWPGIDRDLENMANMCSSCAGHQRMPEKPINHPWIIPDEPWIRVHIDHAINFMGCNWLVVTDAYSKYPCIHATSSTSTRATINSLEKDFAHFGLPVSIVSDNATTFTSGEFQEWCEINGITHLTGAPYHPATNGAAERLIQSFKQSLRKSSLPPKQALQEFLMMYRRTALPSGLSPSELLNGRQIRSKIDIIKPSPAADAQKLQARELSNEMRRKGYRTVRKIHYNYSVGAACYAKSYWRHKEREARWIPATVIEVLGCRRVRVQVYPTGPIWIRHIHQLQPRFGADEDDDPGDVLSQDIPKTTNNSSHMTVGSSVPARRRSRRVRTPRMPIRRSERPHQPRIPCNC